MGHSKSSSIGTTDLEAERMRHAVEMQKARAVQALPDAEAEGSATKSVWAIW